MKTFLVLLALCATCVAAEKKPDPAAAVKDRQARQRLAMDLRRVADKLTADEVKAVQAIVAKHQTKPSAPAKPVSPTKK
jgi:LPS O-antigen subunit length determinant protein (WzzB/FepE family)